GILTFPRSAARNGRCYHGAMRAFAVLIIACLAPSACEPSPEGPAPPPSPSTLLLKSSDAVFHNVRASGAYEFNVGLGGGSPSTLGPLRRKGVVAVACDIHAWMSGYLYVTDSPHAAVTGPDGRFRIGGV